MDRVGPSWVDASEAWAAMQTLYDKEVERGLVSSNVEQIGSQHAAVLNNKPQIPMLIQLMGLDKTHATNLLELLPGYRRAQETNGQAGSLGSVEELKALAGRFTEMAGGAPIAAALELMLGKAEMRMAVMLQMASLVAA